MAKRPKHCRDCGKPATEKRPISRHGKCPPCAIKAVKKWSTEMTGDRLMATPTWRKRWAAGMERAGRKLGGDE